MHLIAFYFAAIDWSYVLRESPARVVAIAVFVSTTLQGIKRFFPLLSGWYAVAANAVLSATLILAATNPDQIFAPATLSNVIIAILGAAGIHGTGKLMFSDDEKAKNLSPANSGPTFATKLPALFLVLGLSLAVVGLGGCNTWERTTFQTLSATKADIDAAAADYNSGKIPQTVAANSLISKARALQATAVDSFATYKKIKIAKGTQSAIDAQVAIVNQAVAALPAIIADIKALTATAAPRSPAKPIRFHSQPYRARLAA